MHLFMEELRQLYFELVTTIVPGPASWSYFIPLVLLPLGLLVPPSTLSHGQLCAIVLPISLAASAHAWLVLGGNDVISTDCMYMTLYLYFFKDPRRNFKRIVRLGHDDGKANVFHKPDEHKQVTNAMLAEPIVLEPYPEAFSRRVHWAVMLPQARPLHDWIIGNPSHDRQVLEAFNPPTQSHFTLDLLSRLLPVLLISLPVSKHLAASDPYFHDPSTSILAPYTPLNSPSPTAAFLQSSLSPLLLRPLTIATYAYSLLLLLFLPPMLLPVLLHAMHLIPASWSPHTWRPHFGPFRAILDHGLRGFWGKWWHQQMRHIVSEPGRWAAAQLGLESSGWQGTAKYLILCATAFALSGVTHAGLVPPRPRWAHGEAWELRWKLACFFWVQPLGVAVEVLGLERVLRRLDPWLQRSLRFVWTLAWMCFSCTFLVAPFARLGYWDIVPLYPGLLDLIITVL